MKTKSYALGGRNNNNVRKRLDGEYMEGSIETPLGIVDVFSQDYYTQLCFCWFGWLHVRTWNKGFTRRGLSILASRFSKDISRGE